jgi:hypothetical protein
MTRTRRAAGIRPYAVTSPPPAGAWEEVLASAPGALPSQTPTWMRCVCTVGGYEDVTRLYQTSDGRRLVLPLARRSRLGGLGSMVASLPTGWGPGGLLGEKGVVHPEDVRMVFADLERDGLRRVSLRPDPAMAATWDVGSPEGIARQPLTAQTLSLEGGFDEVWRSRFRSNARNRVRRAQRAGVTVECDDTGRLVPVFQKLYAKSIDRWAHQEGLPLAVARFRARRREPASKLRTVAEALGTRCRIYAAFLDGRAAAAIVVVYGATSAAYWRAAMDEELAGRTYANYLLHRTAIEDAAAAGCTAYNMGDSAPESQLALFKSRFGAIEHRYATYQIDRLGIGLVADRVRRRGGEALKRWRGRE